MKGRMRMLIRKLTTAIFIATLFVGSTIAPLAGQSSQSIQNDNKMSDGMMKDNKMSNKKHGKHKRHAKHKTNDKMQSNKRQ
jgi:hypothetical protein